MKGVFLSSVGALLLAAIAGQAGAADLGNRYSPPPYTKAPPAFNPVYNWTGFYLGVNGGGGWGQSKWDSVGSFNTSGGLVGGTVGYNWQTGPWVLGLEGDVDWANINGTAINAVCPLGCKTTNDWLATVRGRVGYAFDRFLPYVTGGLAVGDIKAATPFFLGDSTTNAGWTVGGGVEVAIVNNWTIKGEYLFVDLGKFNCGLNCGLAATNNVSTRLSIARAGLNYRF